MNNIRLKDFQRRAGQSPDSVYRHALLGYRYIPVHSFADETEEIKNLGIEKKDCWKVDAWLELDEDACFLQVYSSKYDEHRDPGLYARITGETDGWLYLWATIDADYITREKFENIITKFVELGAPVKIRKLLKPGSGLALVGSNGC